MRLEESVGWGEFLDWASSLSSDRIVEEIVALEEFIDCEHAGDSNLIDCILGLREVLRVECVRRLSCVSHNCK